MDRKEYNSCMRPYMTGSKTKEQRQKDMCIGAKLCTGKASNREKAEELCAQPKPPKPAKVGKRKSGQSCEKTAFQVSECVVSKLVDSEVYRDQMMNINSVGSAIANAIIECQCPKQ